MLEYYALTGLDLYDNPMAAGMDGALIYSKNIISYPYGAKSKRPGYNSFLNAPDSGTVKSLLWFPFNSGTQFYLMRASGSIVYSSLNGTQNWTQMGNGTITNGNYFGGCIVNSTFIGGDGAGSTRHSTNGTSFTNTTGAPVGQYWEEYQGRAYVSGTNSYLQYSVASDATNWSSGGTSDSSALFIPGGGSLTRLFKTPDQLVITKSTQRMYAWNGTAVIDIATRFAPSAPWSVAQTDQATFWINSLGHYMFDGGQLHLLSNNVQPFFYNRQGNGIAGTFLPTAQGVTHKHDYFCTLGSITDDISNISTNNAILNYNFQKNEYLTWQFNDFPTSWLSYLDNNNQYQLIFGNASGQCFQLDLTAASDNGQPIATEMVFRFTYSANSISLSQTSESALPGASFQKEWRWLRFFFSPGCEINVQYCYAETFDNLSELPWTEAVNTANAQRLQQLNWQFSDGVLEMRVAQDINDNRRSRFLFVRFFDNSTTSKWSVYGLSVDAQVENNK